MDLRRRFQFLSSSLRAKVIFGVVLPLILILAIFTGFEYKRQQDVVVDSLTILAANTGLVIEQSLRHAMLDSDFETIQSLLNTIGSSDEFRAVYLLDTDGKVIFSPEGVDVGKKLDNTQAECQPCHRLPADSRPGSVLVSTSSGERVFRSMHPIENSPECARCHDPDDRLLGILLTDISTAPLEAPLAENWRKYVLWWALAISLAVLMVNLAVNRFIIHRLVGLAKAITSFGRGKMPPPLEVDQPDEIGQIADSFNQMAQQVEARSAENQILSDLLRQESLQRGELLKRLITAQEDERVRIARELHDGLGSSLGGLAFQAEALSRMIATKPHDALDQLEVIRRLINDTSNRMYDLILDLRPSVLDDLGLVAAARSHAKRFLDGTGISFDVDDSGMRGRLPPELETTMYRIFQEALSNVVRHADASHVAIKFVRRNGVFWGEVADDGLGFDLESIQMTGDTPRGLGLLGMKERINQCGGHLEIITKPGAGTQIRIEFRLEEASCV